MTGSTYTFRRDDGGIAALIRSENGPYARWFTQIGNRMVNGAKSIANVDTGLMRSRIDFRLEVDGGSLVGILAARTHYAVFVHNGANGHPGNPFLVIAARYELARI